MSGAEDEPPEERLADVLAAYDDRLAAGQEMPTDEPQETVDPALLPEWNRLAAFLTLVEQAWPRTGEGPDRRTEPAPTGSEPDTESPVASVAGQFGRFQILRTLGQGGFGIVFLAWDPAMRRQIALKVPPPETLVTSEARKRFLREAHAAAGLNHPNIVPVYETGSIGTVTYIAAAYCPGPTLADWLGGRTRPVLPRDAAVLVADLAQAVEYAHQQGVLHRDLKPSNILLQRLGADGPAEEESDCLTGFQPRITDFSLAWIADGEGPTTRSGVPLGSPPYMGPEQAEGRLKAIGPPTDVYGLGTILYELLTGHPPFRGPSQHEILRQVIEDDPIPPRRLSKGIVIELEAIVLKCLEKEPSRRYPSASELADDLRRFLELRPIKARRPTLRDRTLKLARRHIGLVAASVLVLLLAVAGLATALVLIGRERDLASASAKHASERAEEARNRAVELERQLYINRVNRAYGEWRDNNIALTMRLLDECPPGLRGWEWAYCRRLCHLERLTIRGRGQAIRSMALSPDGRWVLTAAVRPDEWSPGEWTIWETATGRELETRPAESIRPVAVAPSGAMIAIGSIENPTGVDIFKRATDWPVRFGSEPFRVLRTQAEEIDDLAFSPDGRHLATVSRTARSFLKLWVVGTGQLLHSVDLHARMACAVAFRPDGRQIAVACAAGIVKLWDMTTGNMAGELVGHVGDVREVTYSANGRRIASAGLDETIRVWDGASGSPIHVLRGHGSFVQSLAFSPDGARLASGSADHTVRLWEVTAGKEIGVLRGHSGFVTGVAFSPDGRRIVSASEDSSVKIWDVTTAEPAIPLYHGNWVACALFTPDGSRIASISWDNAIRVWDAATGRQIREIGGAASHVTPTGEPDLAHTLAISPDGRRIASTNRLGTVLLWDASTGQLVRTLRGHTDRTLGVSFDPRGLQLASAGWDGTVRIWDAETGEQVRLFRGPRGVAITAVYNGDGTRVASAFTDGTVRIWDPANGQEIQQFDCESFQDSSPVATNMVVFSPDGRRLAACSNPNKKIRGAGEVRVFDLATGRRILTLASHTSEVYCVAFSPDGRRIVTGSFDQTVKLWETETGQEVLTLRGHTSGVMSVAFSPDGRRLISSSIDHTAKIWDTMSAAEVEDSPRR